MAIIIRIKRIRHCVSTWYLGLKRCVRIVTSSIWAIEASLMAVNSIAWADTASTWEIAASAWSVEATICDVTLFTWTGTIVMLDACPLCRISSPLYRSYQYLSWLYVLYMYCCGLYVGFFSCYVDGASAMWAVSFAMRAVHVLNGLSHPPCGILQPLTIIPTD